jgi:hypothetical protein
MIFFLLLSQIFIFSNQNKYIDNIKIIKEISIYSNNSNSFSNINNISYDNKINNNYSLLYSEMEIKSGYEKAVEYLLILFSVANTLIFCIFRFYYSLITLKLEVNNLANLLLICCIFLSFSSALYLVLPPVSFTYSIYKSFLNSNIIILLYGNNILYFHDPKMHSKKLVIFIALLCFELITSILFLYVEIIRDNFYFICGRNIIEYLILFVVGIQIFLTNFRNLYRQYRFERRTRTVLTLAYKYKLIIYNKVFIFFFLYCLTFIVINIFPLVVLRRRDYNEHYYDNWSSVDEISFIYYMNISFEILLAMIFAIMFFPVQTSLLFFYESTIHLNMYFLTEIKKDKEKTMKINNLSKHILKQKYYKKEYPLILLEPFAKTNNFLNDCHIHVGITKKK